MIENEYGSEVQYWNQYQDELQIFMMKKRVVFVLRLLVQESMTV